MSELKSSQLNLSLCSVAPSDKVSVFKVWQNRWDEIFNSASRLTFKAGQTIFYEGHNPCGLLLLVSGEASLIYHNDSKKKDKWPLFQGIGLDLIFSDSTYPFEAIADSNVVLYHIPKESILTQ